MGIINPWMGAAPLPYLPGDLDVFNLQPAGSKRWECMGGVARLPSRD